MLAHASRYRTRVSDKPACTALPRVRTLADAPHLSLKSSRRSPSHGYRIQTSSEFVRCHAPSRHPVQSHRVWVVAKGRSDLHRQATATIAQYIYPTLRLGRCLMAAQLTCEQEEAKSTRLRYVHIRQGELDGAGGQHCLLMALTILGVQPPGAWDAILSRTSGPYQALATVMKANFFSGMFLDDIAACVDAAPTEISYVACRERSNQSARYVQRFCLKHLRAGSLVIVVILASPLSQGHWTLIVGREEEQAGAGATRAAAGLKRERVPVARALLCLDPCAPAPTINAYNVRLDLTSRGDKRRKCQYVRSDSVMSRVVMTEAIALRLNLRNAD